MKKRAIPQVPRPGEPRDRFDAAVKENLEIITGQRVNQLETLSATATLADVINKVNELVVRLQQ